MDNNKYLRDSSLWNSFLKGDDDAYACIFERYVRVLFMYGSQFTADRELVKDCIQDLFVRIYFKRNSLGQTDNIKYYLFGALRNTIINALKKELASSSDVKLSDTAEYGRDDSSPEFEIREEELAMQQDMDRLMKHLTTRQRQVMHYRYIDNLSLNEISDIMNMSYQAVLNTIQRAIKRIRTHNLN